MTVGQERNKLVVTIFDRNNGSYRDETRDTHSKEEAYRLLNQILGNLRAGQAGIYAVWFNGKGEYHDFEI